MTRSIVLRVVAAIILVAALVGLGSYVFQAGVMQGAAGAAQLKPGQGEPFLPYHGMPYRAHFFGFGFFSLLMCLFLIMVVFGALRAIFGCRPHFHNGGYWGHPGWWGMHRMSEKGDWSHETPPFFEEWHRRAHEQHPPVDKEDKEQKEV